MHIYCAHMRPADLEPKRCVCVHTYMKCISLDTTPRSQKKECKPAVMAAYVGFSTIVDIRHGCLKTTEQGSLAGVRVTVDI